MKKVSTLRFFFLIISLLLIIGNVDNRIRKANFISKYLLIPYSKSVNYFQSLKEKEKIIEQLNQELYTQKIYSDFLFTELMKTNSELDLKDSWISEKDSLYSNLNFERANVISNSFPSYSKIIIINKGKKDGISTNDAVISKYGIVGKVISVTLNQSIVLPFVNLNARFSVMNDNNVQGILNANLNGLLKMSFIEKNSDICIGDTIYTSNLSDVFTQYFAPVGLIDSVFVSNDKLYLEATVSAFTQINNLTTVFVIKKKD